MKNFGLSFVALLVLFGCSTFQDVMPIGSGGAYHMVAKPIQCVPYAREVSGIPIYGDAHTWWGQAAGKYQRGHNPRKGSVMVLSRAGKLKYGHLAVVRNIIDSRTIEVEHSNWGSDRAARAIIYKRMPVRDVSARNDWSQVRFYHYPSKTFGSIYQASGFIYPN